ncbi:MAG TPA: sugar transferase [Ornithinicoccus sp.]|nr:sugar transferase [Ornithinicoccus sp.]
MSHASYLALKRCMDLLVAASGVVGLCPAAVVIAVLIKADSPGPVLFRQTRVGRDGELFEIYKFRTLEVGHDTTEQTYNHSPGVTRIGSLLRRSKLDEVPQLWNVLKGDMSLVGPRPCLPDLWAQMPPWAQARFQVRPGLSGLAQVSGNTQLTWEQRWHFDVRYVEQLSLGMDLTVLARTAGALLRGEEPAQRGVPG